MRNRREFLKVTGAGVIGSALAERANAAANESLVASITKEAVLHGRDGNGPTWFHPKVCMVRGEKGPTAFMTLQTIGGSDYFGPVHWMTSADLGKTWTKPEPVPALGRVPLANGSEEGVCDVVPDWHP